MYKYVHMVYIYIYHLYKLKEIHVCGVVISIEVRQSSVSCAAFVEICLIIL